MRPRIYDAFPFAGSDTELLLLECRLTELYDTVDQFIIVEADVDHQNHAKPLHFVEHRDRYDQWKDKITYVEASGLPDTPHHENPWAREHAQREWIMAGLDELLADDNDIVMQSDADEIPLPFAVRLINPRGLGAVSFRQRGHFWAIDWLYPDPPGWSGTVATRVGALPAMARDGVGPFTAMRDRRNINVVQLEDAGWHFSWLGGPEAGRRKIDSFCHPEVAKEIEIGAAPSPEECYTLGRHVDYKRVGPMQPVEVDSSWPKWMQDPDNIPTSWLRPR